MLQLLSSYKNIDEIVLDQMTEMNLQMKDLPKVIKKLEKSMHDAAKLLDFEKAAKLRDELKKLKEIYNTKK